MVNDDVTSGGFESFPTDCQSVVCPYSAQIVVDQLPKLPADVLKEFVRTSVEALKLADAPDLGFQNRRFQGAPFPFKNQSIYEGKAQFFTIRVAFPIGE